MEELRSVDVIIPSYKPGKKFTELIRRLNKQDYAVNKIIIMNTEESYWKEAHMEEELCEYQNIEVHHITKEEFDHGGTRHRGVQYSKAQIFVCMTDDALPKDEHLISSLVEYMHPMVAVVSARQLPSKNCGVIEAYTRSFNYPESECIKTKADLSELGIKTFFSSNVCAAYNREIYDELGGFIRKTIFNEDMIFAANAIMADYVICYSAKAMVYHSHNFTAIQQFKRNFDLAVSQAEHPEIFAEIKSESEGIKLVKKTAAYLVKSKNAKLLPKLVISSGFKYMGYRAGKAYKRFPMWFVRMCSQNKNYWKKS